MNELQTQNRRVVAYSLMLGLGLSVIAWIVFDQESGIGIWIGVVLGLVGYRMIVVMTASLSQANGQSKGRMGYMIRYIAYGSVLVGMTKLGIPILSMLIGFMAHKASLLIYAFKERKDFHGRTG